MIFVDDDRKIAEAQHQAKDLVQRRGDLSFFWRKAVFDA